jgi:hypothetical protein
MGMGFRRITWRLNKAMIQLTKWQRERAKKKTAKKA